MATSFELDVSRDGATSVVTLVGDLDSSTCCLVDTTLDQLTRNGVEDVRLETSRLVVRDRDGARALADAVRHTRTPKIMGEPPSCPQAVDDAEAC